jgi:hypothetical protein
VSISPGTLFVAFVALMGLLFIGFIIASVGFFAWAQRSDSPRAGRLRRLFGAAEKRREDGAKSFHWFGEEKRLRFEAAKAFAASRGLQYEPTNPLVLSRLQSFPVSFIGGPTTVEDVITWQEEGRSVVLATYIHEVSATRDTRSTYTALLIDTTDLRLPPFYVTGESIGHKAVFGARDIDFVDDAEFSDRYHLESSDEAGVRRFFTTAVRKAFVDVGTCHLECVASTLLFRELEQTTVRGYELFVDDSLKLYRSLAR